MSFFDFLKKKASLVMKTEDVSISHGWDAITEVFEKLYPEQTNPKHRAPTIYRMHDISENAAAFDGISAYDAGSFWHFVTYGLSELYSKENSDAAYSGFGYEFTFRLPKIGELPPLWVFDFLEAIGKHVWKGGSLAVSNTIKTGPLDGQADTKENAVLVLRDPAIPEPIITPNGQLEFLLLLGVEDTYRQKVISLSNNKETQSGWHEEIWNGKIINELLEKNPYLITPIQNQGL